VMGDAPGAGALVLPPPNTASAQLKGRLLRAQGGDSESFWIRGVDDRGRVLLREQIAFAAGARSAEHVLSLPPELRNRLASDDPSQAWAALGTDQESAVRSLAESGDTRYMLGLAYMRQSSSQTAADDNQTATLFQKAADAGSPEAQYELAKLYEQGRGVAMDGARALDLYQKSAAQGYSKAVNDMGFFYYQGSFGLQRDVAKALEMFRQAADLRHPEAMFNYAALIDDGRVPGMGPAEAGRYLYKALRSGSKAVFQQLSDQPNMFKIETRKALQQQLTDFGFYAGALDGDFGPGTTKAVQAAYGLVTEG